MTGRHAAPAEPISVPGWRFAVALVALGSVGPAVVAAYHVLAPRPQPASVQDTPPLDDG
ncbi:hypothetical protein NGB36_28295 [Streptomyces sp. RB6PN25]|uniref:Secreted protein n=1 Tax=Streptomyces humicola TaxID=2953240 RepID=A0ABT1Q369_9ACTN|nr:hypothetical protein [Streptomyces humicola]MCQ4084376.1 hypothetical protein [Streptomyces humicola]